MESYDAIVIGAGVIGSSVAWHLAHLGAKRVLVLDRTQIGNGTTSQSSGILRTHYSIAQNVELARRSWTAFTDLAAYTGDEDAASGIVKCGYLIASPEGAKLEPLRASLKGQEEKGIRIDYLDAAQASELLPIARFDDAALIGYEPEAGFADAYLVATSFARAARKLGVKIMEGVEVTKLLTDNGKVTGVETSVGSFRSNTVISTQNIWAGDIERWTGIPTPVKAERHAALALECDAKYTFQMPVYKDLGSHGMLYCRSYGGSQMLVSEGITGETLPEPNNDQGDIDMDYILEIGAQVAERFPAYETAGLASSWTGVYDVTPDWNPVLGRLNGIEGLVVGYGFSGHGFKLSPGVGLILAQCALGLPTDVSLDPYAHERFRTGNLLTGKYGSGAVS
ncbi:NAD(P)/FAD-dependent oxidoreductase [Derxia gummosa]|uniref:NAD(P)/FAD-dependent oxidoreductase n=1 Tax=Derxia gummosa DSM 723 TaxID=1121388 RepID=A0A8B6X2P0_9BURK|nr:FAD-binding oxidoreductase [Derxia gummosa]